MEKTVAILSIMTKEHLQTSFCFSQVSVLECLMEYSDEWFRPGSNETQTIIREMSDLKVPDFDQTEKVVFDEFTSQTIAQIVNEVVGIKAKQSFFDEQYNLYRASGYVNYWLPQKNILSKYIIPAEPTGFYLSAATKELLIFHSKMHSSLLVGATKYKKVKKQIRRCALLDDCLEPIERLHPEAADLFGYLYWLCMIIALSDE
jgi:hypothetical protein